jgi:hypothetical protein
MVASFLVNEGLHMQMRGEFPAKLLDAGNYIVFEYE